ncbi:MAG: hypothetical protein N5P05_004145 (plasmid) [Chroococcopsis gigantea SAG 12.99]|jgi:hypothetical protein|nr:hypothetical protein [Chroococcopsis gigantea SAG 12.99]
MALTKKERKKLIEKISKASGVAQYALEEKMSDDEITQTAEHLAVLALIKPANNYNRYCQGQKTAEANAKLKHFLDPKNSEIYQVGQWLMGALSKKGKERQNELLEKDLVHKEDYNETIVNFQDAVNVQKDGNVRMANEARYKIDELEKSLNSKRQQLDAIKTYIVKNYGDGEWQKIEKRFSVSPVNNKLAK